MPRARKSPATAADAESADERPTAGDDAADGFEALELPQGRFDALALFEAAAAQYGEAMLAPGGNFVGIGTSLQSVAQLALLPAQRQSVLVSATFPAAIASLAAAATCTVPIRERTRTIAPSTMPRA